MGQNMPWGLGYRCHFLAQEYNTLTVYANLIKKQFNLYQTPPHAPIAQKKCRSALNHRSFRKI